uniref:hypothetical protein n=1 Tax=Chryseobacterium sp. TaxID=1871047 RepID=UPI003219F677
AMGSTLKPKYEANDMLTKFNVHTDAPMREFVFARNGLIDLGPVKFSFFAVGKYVIIHFDYFKGNERKTVEVPILFESQQITAYIKKLYETKEYLND